MLQAYLDESERKGGVFAVAGYVFYPREARRFVREWRQLFPQGFHMVDLLAKRKVFAAISDGERDGLLRAAVQVINLSDHLQSGQR